jgi:MATE family multidrug resistance protein
MTLSFEVKKIIKLSIPLFIAQFSQTAMGFVDTVMAGGVSANDMAAVSIGASLWLPSILFGVGILMALIPLIAQAHGADDTQLIPKIGQQGIYLALILAFPIAYVLYHAGTLISYMNIDPALQSITVKYLHILIPAVPAFLLFQVLRNYVEGMSLTKPAMVIAFIGLLINVPLNWIFVYGKFGAPALGGVGCGVATTIVYWLMLFALLGYVLYARRLKDVPLFRRFSTPNIDKMKEMFKLGLPVALAIFFEVIIFAGIAILVAPLGAIVIASHQIALNFSSMIFMLPMSIANAVSIRVGFNLGRKSTEGAKNASFAGIATGLSLSIITALLTLLFREEIARLYTNNTEVMLLAVTLLTYAAVYQCMDAVQVIACGALRGYKEMIAIFKRTFIAFWIVGLPLGYTLGMTNYFFEPLGAKGFWIGLTLGLTVSSILLTEHLLKTQRKLVQVKA